ncbi:MAG: DUF2232 domain-containing protein [Bacillota bacterium]
MNTRHASARGLVFGGLMAALVVVFAIVPGLALLMPLPLVVVFIRHGGRTALLTAIVAVLMTGAFRGVVNALMSIPAGVFPGLIFGYGLRHKWRPLTIGLGAVAVFFVGFAMTYVLMRVAVFPGRDPVEMMVASGPLAKAQDEFYLALEQVTRAQPPRNEAEARNQEAYLQLLREFREDKVAVAWALLPALVFMGGALMSWINWQLCRWSLPRFGHPVPETAPFEQFTLPVWLVWVYGLLMFATSYAMQTPTIVGAPWWTKLLLNLFTPLGYIFVLAGIAVAYGYLRKRNWSKAAAGWLLAILFLLMFQLAFQLSILLAMWDTIFDFRGLGHGMWKRPEEST